MEENSAAAEYAAALSELTDNTKTRISMLTMLAEDKRDHAPKVIQVIEKYLLKSSVKIKLPTLYLIDSIVKNVKEPYTQLFMENIVSMFTAVFESGDEKVRSALFKLRQTWNGIFSEAKLYLLDISTKRMDPNWPISTSTENLRLSAPIHLNPRFFARQNGLLEVKSTELNENIIRAQNDSKQQDDKRSTQNKPRDDKTGNHVLKGNSESKRESEKERRHDPRLRKKEAAKETEKRKGSRSSHDEVKSKHSKTDSRRSSHDSKHLKRSSSSSAGEMDGEISVPSLEPSLVDKEAAAIFSGDVDLRLLEPQNKKRKEDVVSQNGIPLEDIDLRIRPTGGVSDPGQPALMVQPNPGTCTTEDEDDDVDKAAQWAKVKGTSLSYSTTPVVPVKDLRTPANRSLPTATPGGEVVFQERNSVASIAGLPDATGQQAARKTVRVSDPAPDYGQIRLDGRMREVRFVDGVAIAIMDEIPPHFVRARQIMFRGGTKKIVINDNLDVLAAFDGREHEFTLNGNRHRIRFGAPLRELYIDGIPYACQFNGIPIYIRSREDVFSVTLFAPCPSVNDKMEATPELLSKLGLKPLPIQTNIPPPNAAAAVGAPFVGGTFNPAGPPPLPSAGHIVPPVSGPPPTGGWIRYQEEHRPPPGMFAPMPPNMGPLPPHAHPGHPGFVGPGMFCPPPPHHMGPPFVAYNHPPPLIPPANIPMGAARPVPPMRPSIPPSVINGMPPQQQQTPQVNVSDLLSQLVNAGIIGSGDKADLGSDLKKEREELSRLSFKQPDTLKRRYNSVISALHDGTQCGTCGQRFRYDKSEKSDKYSAHLDWHFRTSRKEREGMKKATSRKWFYDISDWMLFEEVEDVDDRARSYFEIQEAQRDIGNQDEEVTVQQTIPTVSAKTVAQGDNTCFSCHEAFDLFFCEDTEEWRIRNAVLFEENLFHPNCYEDFIKPQLEPVAVKEEQMEVKQEEQVPEFVHEENQNEATYDEGSQQLPGLDFAPSVRTPVEVKEESSQDEQEITENIKEEPLENPEDESMDDTPTANTSTTTKDDADANDTIRIAEQSVILEDLGEFGVDSLPEDTTAEHSGDHEIHSHDSASLASIETNSQDSQTESKMVVKGSGGFVLKMKQDSLMNGDPKAMNESTIIEENEPDEMEDWKPPTPDPVFKSFPPVKKGTEESGLCSIM